MERQERQLKDYKKVVREIKEEVMSMYRRKVQRDAYYQNNDNTFTVSEIY